MNPLYWPDVEVIPATAAFFYADDQPGFLKNLKMLHDGAPIQPIDVLANLAGRHRRLVQEIENPAPISACHRFEDQVVPIIFAILDIALDHCRYMLYFYNVLYNYKRNDHGP